MQGSGCERRRSLSCVVEVNWKRLGRLCFKGILKVVYLASPAGRIINTNRGKCLNINITDWKDT